MHLNKVAKFVALQPKRLINHVIQNSKMEIKI